MRFTFLIFVLLFIRVTAFCQQLILVQPEGLNVCETAHLESYFINTDTVNLHDLSIRLQLPCGMFYVSGTAVGSAEEDLSDLSRPEFSVDSMSASDTLWLRWSVELTCEATECIDAGQLFQHRISGSHSSGTFSSVSPIYNVETAYPIVVDVDDDFISASKGDRVERTVRIRNTRSGRLSQLEYGNYHSAGIVITIPDRTIISTSEDHILVSLSGNDFMQIGNGDAYFDLNEEVVIDEIIDVVSCAFNVRSAFSRMNASWGCDSMICQTNSKNAIIQINDDYDEGDILEACADRSEIVCVNGQPGSKQSLHLKNTGTESTIRQLTIEISQTTPGTVIYSNSMLCDDPDAIILYDSSQMASCGLNGFVNSTIVIDQLDPGSEVMLNWESAACILGCTQIQNTWSYRYSYEKACAPQAERYIEPGMIQIGSLDAPAINTNMDWQGPSPILRDGQALAVLKVEHPELTAASGNISIRLSAPCELDFMDSDFEVEGKLPVQVSIIPGSTKNSLELTYELPFNKNELTIEVPVQLACSDRCTLPSCVNEFITSCEDLCSGAVAEDEITWRVQVNPEYQCPIGESSSVCGSFTFRYICVDEVCPIIVPGYIKYSMDLYRINFGWPDNDEDHIADANGVIDLSKVATHRVLPGDTFRIHAKGSIIEDVDSAVAFSHGLLTIQMSSIDQKISGSTVDNQLDNLFNDSEHIKTISNYLLIKDASTAETYILNNIGQVYDDNSNELDINFNIIQLAQLNIGFPANFRFEKGDSIEFIQTNILNTNFRLNGWMDLELAHRWFMDDKPISKDISFHCGCEKLQLGLRSHQIQYTFLDVGNRTYCTESFIAYDTRRYITVNSAKKDFPFEIRSAYRLHGIEFEKGADLKIDSIKYTNDESPAHTSHLPIDEPSIYLYPYDTFLVDEYSRPRVIVYASGGQCPNPYRDESISARWSFVPQEKGDYLDTIYASSLGYSSSPVLPKMRALEDDYIVESNTDRITWEVDLEISELPCFNTWCYVDAPDEITYIELIVDGISHSIGNGELYQFGDLAEGDTLSFEIVVQSATCRDANITLHYGCHCEEYTDKLRPACLDKHIELTGRLLPGKIEHFVESPVINLPLCVDTGSVVSSIFNAELGRLRNVTTTIDVPVGMRITSGSCEIAYPLGSSNWRSIPDPSIQPSGYFGWDWADILPDVFIHGLRGSGGHNEHGFNLRFDFLTECDFLSGSNVIFRTIGEQICGDFTNNLAKVSGTIYTQDAGSDLLASVNLIEFNQPVCNGNGSIDFRLSTSGNIRTKDSLFVRLPQSIKYHGQSWSALPVERGNLLSWSLQEVPGDDSLRLEFSTNESTECGQDIITFYVGTRDTVYCQMISGECPITVVNTRMDLILNNEFPNIKLNSFSYSGDVLTGDGSFSVTAENYSVNKADSLIFYFVLDIDDMIGFSDGDIILSDFVFHQGLDSFELSTFSIDNMSIDLNDLCRLMLVISPDANCICNGDFIYLQKPIEFNNGSRIPACSGELVDLGVSATDFWNYQWVEYGLVSCDSCSSTSFLAENNSQNVIEQSLTLIAENENCRQSIKYTIDIQPSPKILTDPKVVCPGDTIYLFSTEGIEYIWSGIGIIDTSENSALVSPDSSGYVFVEITDAIGCVGKDSVFIKVLPPAIADAGVDLQYCFGENEAQLSAVLYDGLNYRWLFAVDNLEDVNGARTRIMREESRDYILEVTNGLCFDYDTVNVEYYKEFEVEGLPDTTDLCAGSDVFIQLGGADTYNWIPWYQGMCVDSTCSEVSFIMPHDSFEWKVIGSNARGCLDTARGYVRGYIDTVLVDQDTSLCLYNDLVWRNLQIDSSGLYWDTIALSGYCAEVTGLQVDYIPMDTIFLENTLCLGDSIDFFGSIIQDDGIFYYLPDSVRCDTVYELVINYFEEIEGIADTFYFQKDICEPVRLVFPDIFEGYSWYPDIGLDCYSCAQPVVLTNDTANYALTVLDENGCQEDFTFVIDYHNCINRHIYIPNAFSPNNDGINDEFTVYPGVAVDYVERMQIYDRWGGRVYDYKNENGVGDVFPKWSGELNGKLCNQGAYVVVTDVVWKDGTRSSIKGDVLLIN